MTQPITPAYEQVLEALAAAYSAGATDTHNWWAVGNVEREADFGEAASDYARSIDLTALAMRPAPETTASDDVVAWECFCCPASFDMWRVRKTNERGFEQGFLVANQESAEGLRDYLNALANLPKPTEDFQIGVDRWMDACFGEAIKADKVERADRFCEEALELCQTMPGFTKDRAHALVDYVFDRPQGEINQEVGGVMVTLAALCNTTGVRIDEAAATELARVWTKVEQIRAKQASKPTGSALPVPKPTEQATSPAPEAITQLQAKVERLEGALRGIETFGFRHPGHGHSCAILARQALSDKVGG